MMTENQVKALKKLGFMEMDMIISKYILIPFEHMTLHCFDPDNNGSDIIVKFGRDLWMTIEKNPKKYRLRFEALVKEVRPDWVGLETDKGGEIIE